MFVGGSLGPWLISAFVEDGIFRPAFRDETDDIKVIAINSSERETNSRVSILYFK